MHFEVVCLELEVGFGVDVVVLGGGSRGSTIRDIVLRLGVRLGIALSLEALGGYGGIMTRGNVGGVGIVLLRGGELGIGDVFWLEIGGFGGIFGVVELGLGVAFRLGAVGGARLDFTGS